MNTPSIRRRDLLAAAGLLPALTRAADSKIRVGILCIQHSHLPGKLKAMQENPDYEVTTVCEPNMATREQRGGNAILKGLRWVGMDEMLADKNLDLIVFEGEVKDAIPYGKRVLEANKHLHLEKPPTNKLEPFAQLVDVARQRERRLQLGYLWRFHPGTDLALDAAKNGWLGDVFMIRATINSDRDMAQRAVEARFGGGSMFELGGHMIDRIVALSGRPDAVRPWLRHDTSVSDAVKDNTLAVLEYPKSLAVVISSNRDAVSHRSFEVIGTDGSILVDPMEAAITVRIQLREARGPYKKGVQEVKFPPQPRFVKDFEELARSIKSVTPLKYSYDHELHLHETLLRASGEIT
jgi:predicted dehydrogenase